MTTARPPEALNLSDPAHKGEYWRKFERAWKNFARAAKITKEDRETQVAALLNVIGDSALDLYETFTFTPPADAEDEDDADPEAHITVDAILAKFREYCEPKVDAEFERYQFYRRDQETGESLNDYIIAVRKLARTCKFGERQDESVTDRLLHGIRNQRVRQKLFDQTPLTLDMCVQILRASELNAYRSKQITEEVDGAPTHHVSHVGSRKPPLRKQPKHRKASLRSLKERPRRLADS